MIMTGGLFKIVSNWAVLTACVLRGQQCQSICHVCDNVWRTDETMTSTYADHDTSRKKKEKKGSPVNLSGLLLELELARGTVWKQYIKSKKFDACYDTIK